LKLKNSSLEKAKRILSFALKKKALEPLILDLRGFSWWWDYFVIVSSSSSPQTIAIVEEVIKEAKKVGYALHHKEEDSAKSWVLVDFYDVVLHVFSPEKRKLYNLEHLWEKAKKLKIEKL